MINIVIPMAGEGTGFKKEGYDLPKPMVMVGGKSLVKWVIDSVKPEQEHRFIFIIQKKHNDKWGLEERLKFWEPDSEVVIIPELTEGAAQTVLTAEEFIDSNDPVMISNCDQYAEMDVDDYLAEMDRQKADALILTTTTDHPRRSYIKFEDGKPVDVIEKKVVSNEATLGIYNCRHGSDFCKYAKKMIDKNIRTKGEFYVAPVFGMMVKDGKRLAYKNYKKAWYLGSPEEAKEFEKLLDWKDELVCSGIPREAIV